MNEKKNETEYTIPLFILDKNYIVNEDNEIIIVDPALYLPCKSSSERGSSSNLCIDLLRGLAPNSLSYPCVAKNSLASSESTISISEFLSWDDIYVRQRPLKILAAQLNYTYRKQTKITDYFQKAN